MLFTWSQQFGDVPVEIQHTGTPVQEINLVLNVEFVSHLFQNHCLTAQMLS